MITRHNYEEFFLLYLDNELPDADRKAVEQFVQDNPDLETELKSLQQAVLRPDEDLLFDDKSVLLNDSMASGPGLEQSLFRGELPVWAGESDFIDESSYPTYLLSYIDNELDEESRKAVEHFVLLHPRLGEELALLQQARLQADPDILFPGKELLYKQQDARRAVLVPWSRVAAAILLLLAGLFLLDRMKKGTEQGGAPGSSLIAGGKNMGGQNKDGQHGEAQAAGAGQRGAAQQAIGRDSASRGLTENKKDIAAVTPDTGSSLNNKARSTATGGEPEADREERVAAVPQNRKGPRGTESRTGKGTGKGTTPQNDRDEGSSAAPGIAKGVVAAAGKPGNAAGTAMATEPVKIAPLNPVASARTTNSPVASVRTANPPAADSQAVASNYNKPDMIALSDEGIPIEDPSANKKSKLRGLFRRVSRVFEKNTNGGNGVLVGSFQIAVK